MSKLDELERLLGVSTPGLLGMDAIAFARLYLLDAEFHAAIYVLEELKRNVAPVLAVARAAQKVPEALNWLETKGPGEPIHPGVVQVLDDFYAALRELEGK